MDAFAVFVGFAILFVNRTNVFTAFTRVFFRERAVQRVPGDDPSDEVPGGEKEAAPKDPAELPEEEPPPPPARSATPAAGETIDGPPKVDEPARLGLFTDSMPTFNDMLNVLTRWTHEDQPPASDRTPAREEANCSPFLFIET